MEKNIKESGEYSNLDWVDYKQLIEMFNFPGIKSAKDKKWRIKNKSPYHQTGENCALVFSVSAVQEWLENSKRKK